jgi:uncharacterized protein (UPF0147 family)
LALAIGTLENIQANYSYKANRNSKKLIRELLDVLQNEDQNISLSIRAANAISTLDGMTQDRSIESHIRTMLCDSRRNAKSGYSHRHSLIFLAAYMRN